MASPGSEETMPFCRNCGMSVEKDDKFCTNCGVQFHKTDKVILWPSQASVRKASEAVPSDADVNVLALRAAARLEESAAALLRVSGAPPIYSEIRRRAQELVDRREVRTVEQGVALVCKREPALYRQHVAERHGSSESTEARVAFVHALVEQELEPLLKGLVEEDRLTPSQARVQAYRTLPFIYATYRKLQEAAEAGASVAELERGHDRRATMTRVLCAAAVMAVQKSEGGSFLARVQKLLAEPAHAEMARALVAQPSRPAPSPRAYSEVREQAAELVKNREARSLEQGVALVFRRNPGLYERHRAEQLGPAVDDDGPEAA